jgi:phenylalanine-4-hydroxylase
MLKQMKYGLMVFMSRRMIACDEASFLISYRHDNRLGFRRQIQLKMHLLTCHLCRKYARQIEQLNLALERYREGCSSPACQHHLDEEAGLKIQEVVSRELNAN